MLVEISGIKVYNNSIKDEHVKKISDSIKVAIPNKALLDEVKLKEYCDKIGKVISFKIFDKIKT